MEKGIPILLLKLVFVFFFGMPTISRAQSQTGVVVERWDITSDRFTGIIHNKTENGIYGLEVSFTFRDSEGKVLSAAKIRKVVGTPAVIEGELYFDFSFQQTLDYIPPNSLGYFEQFGSLPAGTDTSKVDINIIWKWAANAQLANELSLIEETLTLREESSFVGPKTIFSGEVANNTQSAVRDVNITIIPIHNDGHVITVSTIRAVDRIVNAGNASAFTWERLRLDKDDIKLLIHAIRWEIESQPPPGLPPPSPGTAPTIVYVPLDTLRLTVHDTFEVTIRDTISLRDTLEVTVRDTVLIEKSPRLVGDLNDDNAVDFADFLILAQQFGKKLGL